MSPLQTCLLLARAEVEVRRRLEVQGLSLSELAALRHLSTAPDRTCRRQELSDTLGFTPSGVTRLLAPLEKLGYVARIADPRDARRAMVVLTDAGAERTADAVAQAEERAVTLLDQSLAPEQQQVLGDLLAALVPFS